MKKDFNKIIPDLEMIPRQESKAIINEIHRDDSRNVLKLLDEINNKTLELEATEAARFLENIQYKIKFYNQYNIPNLTFVKDQYKDMVEIIIKINLTNTPPTLYKFKIKKLHLFELDVLNNSIKILKSFEGQTFNLTINQQLMLLEFINGIIAKYNEETNETDILEHHVFKVKKGLETHIIYRITDDKSKIKFITSFDII